MTAKKASKTIRVLLNKEEAVWLRCLLTIIDLGWLSNTEGVTGKTASRQNRLKHSIQKQLDAKLDTMK